MAIEYRVDDALAVLRSEPDRSAGFIHLDDAWARPSRNGAFGVEYPTHPFDEDAVETVADDPGVVTDLTVTEILDACWRALRPGGILAVDVDSYLLPNVLSYVSEEWSPTAFALAQVTALTNAGEPDQSTPGMYFSSGGYTTVFVWRGASPVPQGHPLREHHRLHCPCQRQREDYGWGTVKPLAPFRQWLNAYTEADDRILIPCAGTAPAAIAAEEAYGETADVLAVDIEADAKAAYERRRQAVLSAGRQQSLAGWSA